MIEVRREAILHVLPEEDSGRHCTTDGPFCWCAPDVEMYPEPTYIGFEVRHVLCARRKWGRQDP